MYKWLIGGLEHVCFPIYWECHHPKWRTPSFVRGLGTCWNHQPDGLQSVSLLSLQVDELVATKSSINESCSIVHSKVLVYWAWIDAHKTVQMSIAHLWVSIFKSCHSPCINGWLVVWNIFVFQYIGNVIIPSDELHHLSEGLEHVGTTNQMVCKVLAYWVYR